MWDFVERWFITPVYTGEGYNVYNTLAYAALFIVALYAAKWALGKWKIKANERLFYALLPYFVFGGLLRALQDYWPVKHWLLITPGIYLLVAALAIGVLLATGKDLRRMEKIGWLVVAAGAGLVTAAAYAGPFRVEWLFAIAGAAVLIVFALWKAFPKLLASRENRVVAFAQVLDACASAIPIAFLGYGEQHVVSGWVMQLSPFLFPAIKVALVIAALHLIDKEKNEWNWLLKIAVVVLGLGPGVRDLARVFIGV